MTNRMTRWCLCICSMAVIAGCSQKQMDMSAMKPPERPKELDMLESWTGTWQATGDMTMADGKTMKSSGKSTIGWECDKFVLVEKMEHEMEGMGKMSGMVVYSWNPGAKCYNTNYFSSMGECSGGTMKYDADKKCFCMSGKGKNPMTGETTNYVGHMKLTDSSTMEWTWEEWDGWKMKKTCCGKGIAKRM